MPLNNDLPDLKNPVPKRFGEKPKTKFKEHLQEINVRLMNSSSMFDLKQYVPGWGTATWHDDPLQEMSTEECTQVIQDMFDGNILPSSRETVQFVFLLSNIDKVDVTHLLRHRDFSFSAVCSADRDLRHEKALVKNSIREHESFAIRFCHLVQQCKELYAEMVDTKEISMLDARTILPVCLEHHYFVRCNLNGVINFVSQRIDRQIQPESDNIVALKMWIEVVKQFPQAKKIIDVHRPDMFYCKTVPTGRNSNIYMPEIPRNDTFEYKKQWFIYKKQRSEMRGGQLFVQLWNALVEELESL